MTTWKSITNFSGACLILFLAHLDGSQAQHADLDESATPEAFAVQFETTNGNFVIEAYREWSPNAVDRFFALVNDGYFDGNLFYWIVPGQDARFGIHNKPEVTATWVDRGIDPDPQSTDIRRGHVYFHPGDRGAVAVLLSESDAFLSSLGVTPFGRVVGTSQDQSQAASLDVLESLDTSLMDAKKRRRHFRGFFEDGGDELIAEFPRIDSIVRASILDRPVPVPALDEEALDEFTVGLPQNHALVRIYRSPLTGQRKDFNLRIDGEMTAELKEGTFYDAILPAGRHEFEARVQFGLTTGFLEKALADFENLVIDVEPGRVYFVRGSPVRDSSFFSAGDANLLQLTPVTEFFGVGDSTGLEPARLKGGDD